MSFTDRDGVSGNLGEAVQWHFDNDRMSDVGNYVVINRNDYSSSVDIIDGYRSISNVQEMIGHGTLLHKNLEQQFQIKIILIKALISYPMDVVLFGRGMIMKD